MVHLGTALWRTLQCYTHTYIYKPQNVPFVKDDNNGDDDDNDHCSC